MDDEPLLPPRLTPEELATTSIRVPKELLKALDAVAKTERMSRTQIITYFVQAALRHYERQKKAKK